MKPTHADLERLVAIEALQEKLPFIHHEVRAGMRWLTIQLREAWDALADAERRERVRQEQKAWLRNEVLDEQV